jgi:hypothetical protein
MNYQVKEKLEISLWSTNPKLTLITLPSLNGLATAGTSKIIDLKAKERSTCKAHKNSLENSFVEVPVVKAPFISKYFVIDRKNG